ncbi:hypothetical protein [Pseudoxanthomonas wuyuanensis]
MKSSPLQLKWVTYPSASFEAVEAFDGDQAAPLAATVDAVVSYDLEGLHTAFVTISDDESKPGPYKFSMLVVSQFAFDLDRAKETYRPSTTRNLPPVIAVNVSRILYAGAREMLSMMTARAPYQAAMLDSVLLEPGDVQIKSTVSAEQILETVFKATPEEMAAARDSVAARLATSSPPKKTRRKADA